MEDRSAAAMDPDGAGSVDLSICGSADWAPLQVGHDAKTGEDHGNPATVTGRAVQLMFKCSNHSTSSTVSTCLNLNKYQR